MLVTPIRTCLATLSGMIFCIVVVAETAQAFGRHDYGLKPGQRWVYAESDYGNGAVRAPIRYTRKGPQIRLPGGNWIYCDHTCSETLRLATVDFWESDAADRDSGNSGCGLLTCRWKFGY